VSLVSTPAILLRAHPYSETSQILRFLTESHGIQSVMAKGIRKRGGKGGGSISTFAQGELTLYLRDNRELQTFKDFSTARWRRELAAHPLRMAAASVLAELVLQHSGSDASPGLFRHMEGSLDLLGVEAREALVPLLLTRLWSLIGEMGYAPVLRECVECGRGLSQEEMARFDFPSGGLRCGDCQGDTRGPRIGPGARAQLAELLDGDVPENLRRPRAHLRLVSDFVTYHISGGTPLRSMEVLYTLIPTTHA
jgi:DNA repair protein RecO